MSHGHEMDSPSFEWCIGKCPGLCTMFFKTGKYDLKLMLYHALLRYLGHLSFLTIVMPKLSSGSFNYWENSF